MKIKVLSLLICAFLIQNCTKKSDGPSNASLTNKEPINQRVSACFSNPIINEEGGDPFCFKYNGTYYMYRPSNKKVIYNTSTDLVNWSSTDTLNYSSTKDIWAPEVHKVGSDLYLYYAIPNGANGGRDILSCKLISPTSAGSNTAVTMVGAANDEINIDPTVYQEGTNYYMLWKNVGTGNSRIRIRELNSSNGTQFASGSSPENPLNKEHPFLLREDYDGGTKFRYYLFFDSGIGDTQDYKVSFATSNSLMGTYTHQGTLMSKNASRNIYSIGGHSVVRDGNNYRWMVYRAKNTSSTGWAGRKPCIDRLLIDASAGTAVCEPTRTQSAYCPAPL
jgi:hypothetical protein